jgi:lysophospholipase L1-like esterase
MVVRPTIAGQRLRVRLSNEFGATPFTIGSAHVALVKQDGEIIPESDRPLTFAGNASVSIPAGAPMLSDPVDLSVPAFADVAISIFVPMEASPSTYHLLGQHDTYISGPGDFTGSADITNPKVTKSWYWVAGMEFWETDRSAAIVTLGDSITDGFGAKTQYGDWPNQLADRLAETKDVPGLAVDNEGIGGNRILHDGAGVSALARFDRDVLSQPGVEDLIILEGINDIGWPHMKPRTASDGTVRQNPWAGEMVTSDDLIQGLKQMIERAHEHGIRVFGATMTPYGGNTGTFTDDGEAVRQAVNRWIRTSGAFDGVFDFDAAVRDPENPVKFRDVMQTGDYLHPNAAGYKAMAGVIDLSLLRGQEKTDSSPVPGNTK